MGGREMSGWVRAGEVWMACCREGVGRVEEVVGDLDKGRRWIGRDGAGSHCCSCGCGGGVDGGDGLLKWA